MACRYQTRMKFAKQYQAEKELHLSAALQRECISYKAWKKVSKVGTCAAASVCRRLCDECKRVDKVFRKHYKRVFQRPSGIHLPRPFASCVNTISSTRTSLAEVKAFASLNSLCLYKVCKRLDKRLQPSPQACDWLTRVRSEHKFQFLGGPMRTCLDISEPVECPICMCRSERVCVSRCGHFICPSCLVSIYGIHGRRGMLRSLVSHIEYTQPERCRCPICRCLQPFSSMVLWPPVRSVSITRGVH